MQSKNKWSADDYRRAQEMRQGGCTYREIAEKTGLTVNAVYGRMNRPMHERIIELTREFDEYELEKMREMRLGGSTLKAIAEYFGCSADLISTRLRMMGVTRQGFLDENLTRQALSLRAEGMPYHEIARRLDLTASEMHRVRTAIRRSYDADERKS